MSLFVLKKNAIITAACALHVHSLDIATTSNNVYFFIHNSSRSRHILHCSVLHLRPHVPGNVIHLQKGRGDRGEETQIE